MPNLWPRRRRRLQQLPATCRAPSPSQAPRVRVMLLPAGGPCSGGVLEGQQQGHPGCRNWSHHQPY